MSIEYMIETLGKIETYLKKQEALAYENKAVEFGQLVQRTLKQCQELQGALLVIETLKEDF